MRNRREFIRNAAGAAAAAVMGRHVLAEAGLPSRQVGAPPGKRREVSIGGRRVKTVDVHAHCFVPEVMGPGQEHAARRDREGEPDRQHRARQSRSA